MTFVALRSTRNLRRDHRRRRNRALLALSVGTLGLVGVWRACHGGADQAPPVPIAAVSEPASARTARGDHAWMLDPHPVIARDDSGSTLSAPLAPDFRLAAVASLSEGRQVAEVHAAAPEVPEPLAPSGPLPTPLPVPRPPEFRREPVAVAARLVRRPPIPSTQSVFRAAGAQEPSLFDRIFGLAPVPTALGYAAVDGTSEATPSRRRLVPAPIGAQGTAVYDITAQRVTLPNGEVLEAHSGLGASQDNPRTVHLTMRGATPPGTYELKEREALFHGVRAIRLNPVGGPQAIHGRVGLLAHTYMLGPSGASNGCVVFRDYQRFLQAYLRGDIQRLVVVAGNGQDGPPSNGRRYGMSSRSAKGG